MRKIGPAKFANFVIFVLRTGICITFGNLHHNVVHLARTQYKLIQNLQISQGYIFLILQHFATKLCSFTNFGMLFLAMVRDAGTIKRQRGANAHQRGTSIDPGEDINLQ
jgi:hypothetical protein